MPQKKLKIIECPRDAMQGIHDFIPTEQKISYINQLLKVGFDTIDFGSFVSSKVIPQMEDTAEVLEGLDLSKTNSKLLAIVANERGAEEAGQFDEINYLGYPFSISETFQKRNTHASIHESLGRVEEIQNICQKSKKKLVIYISMGFGNPYGDPYHEDIVAEWLSKLSQFDIKTFALSDTIGVANKELIADLFSTLIPEYPNLEIGAHLHTTPAAWEEKITAAYNSGCRRFDGAILGYGGCPMATDSLTGNMPTEKMIEFLNQHNDEAVVDMEELNHSLEMANTIFPK